MVQEQAVVIGGGFAGLSAACFLAKKGYKVKLVDRHDMLGGRARYFETKGFKFDMGPSWYWMPDVFENFFAKFGKKVSDYYKLKRLDPPYRVYFGKDMGDAGVCLSLPCFIRA
jgi:phytoene desaturase